MNWLNSRERSCPCSRDLLGLPQGHSGKEPACTAREMGSIPRGEDPPGKETAAHAGTLAWKIPWAEEPGGLQSMGLQKRTTRLRG